MKKLIFTLAMGMLASIAFPQSYHKLIRTNTFWDEFFVVLPDICYTSAERVFFTNQDTVINGFTYKISKQQNYSQVNPGPFCPPFVIATSSDNTYQFLREDTVSKKVYIYTPDYYGGTDQLLYDFSLLPGDTLKSAYTGAGVTLILDTIRNFVLSNGEHRKQLYFGPYPYSDYYIEGIGGSMGLFQPIVPGIESYGGYFCVKENSVVLMGDQCDYPYVGQNEMKDEPVSLFPNPANSFINIIVPRNPDGSDFILVNLQGEQVLSHSLNHGSNTFSISDLIPGVYFYQVKSNQFTHYGKLTIY
jgi:Secretion system C-terminal sorting domain